MLSFRNVPVSLLSPLIIAERIHFLPNPPSTLFLHPPHSAFPFLTPPAPPSLFYTATPSRFPSTIPPPSRFPSTIPFLSFLHNPFLSLPLHYFHLFPSTPSLHFFKIAFAPSTPSLHFFKIAFAPSTYTPSLPSPLPILLPSPPPLLLSSSSHLLLLHLLLHHFSANPSPPTLAFHLLYLILLNHSPSSSFIP